MPGLTGFLKRHIIWAGFLAVLLPLLVMLSLQLGWLLALEETTVLAHQKTLDNYLDKVVSDVSYFYQSQAERALNLPAGIFTNNRLEKAAWYFDQKGAQGAQHMFILSFSGPTWRHLYFFEPSVPSMDVPTDLEAARAIHVAASPWEMLARKQVVLEKVHIVVDERDPYYRLILNPILDDNSRIVGLAGMVVDQHYFRTQVLPRAIKKSLPASFSERDWKNVAVTVRDGKGSVRFSTYECNDQKDEARRAFSFVFADWRVGLNSGRLNPKEWAEASFKLNLGLSVAIAAVLLGGVALALRTASREMKLSQMKSDFVSNVSHELRTPLASIRVFGEFLKLGRAGSPEKVREYGEFIETESRRLTRLINNILDFSRIDSGRKTYHFQSSDLRDVVCETLRTFEVRCRNSGFGIRLETPDGPLPAVRIDADAIGQALNNLLDNAVKYSNGAREIGVRLGRENGWILIEVQDHGIGISREEQAKIFERFHRVSTGLVHDVKGSGLGLAIVEHIVKAHQGRVEVVSEVGKGSTFIIRLPVEPDIATAAGEAAGAQPEPPPLPLTREDSHA